MLRLLKDILAEYGANECFENAEWNDGNFVPRDWEDLLVKHANKIHVDDQSDEQYIVLVFFVDECLDLEDETEQTDTWGLRFTIDYKGDYNYRD